MFAFGLAGALALPLGFLLAALINGGLGGWIWRWEQVPYFVVIPPAVALFIVWTTYPYGSRILAFILGAFYYFGAYVLFTAAAMKVSDVFAHL